MRKFYSGTLFLVSAIRFAIPVGIALVPLTSCTPSPNSEATAPSSTPKTEQQQQIIRASGGSSTIEVLQLLMDAYTKKVTNTQANFLPASQSESTLAGIQAGLLDIGSLSKTLKPTEITDDLAQRVIAQDGLVVATNPSVEGVTNLTTDNLKAIYSGQAKNWQEFGGPDATIVVLDRPEDESAKRLLREYYLGKDLVTSPDAVILRKQDELVSALQSTPYSIGTFSLATAIYEKVPVNHLSLNGIAPTLDNIKSGKYLMVRPINLVFKKSPAPQVQSFIDFLSSPEAIALLTQAGYAPANMTP
ncbi:MULTISPECIES: substrate-binding domain-containing protein [Planktothricoides]|uniref:Substrate-binding domain-containing protein n=1 Tax=Planktothricoides raciborskii FACHB-1370 TaxID=2949576 RepID=A0ABR8EC39_9CYAN|nr:MULTISPECIES: substrate-binding domain-containing protein [Planktothricoides]KOR34586.1 hypothetical protein AM228_23135 [Planktothricoides sp. SR001]MBD2544429.1 substrate-binding domain-containing protein [Planktothricoides raciborskii FACHB-1370]MBD2585522.1 substrate-binding domain-containing protein [Planktothricoides raciborskii FACHB-1261]